MIVEPNTKTDFFYVDGEYIEYLKSVEVSNRGFTCVPNVHYWNTNKFVFGALSRICCCFEIKRITKFWVQFASII